MRAPTRTPEQTPGSGPTRYTTSKDATREGRLAHTPAPRPPYVRGDPRTAPGRASCRGPKVCETPEKPPRAVGRPDGARLGSKDGSSMAPAQAVVGRGGGARGTGGRGSGGRHRGGGR